MTLFIWRQEGHPARKNIGDGGGGHWLVRMEWRPPGWSVCLPLLISRCTIKSRSSRLAPAHPGGPGKRAVKRLWWWWLLTIHVHNFTLHVFARVCVCVCVCACVCGRLISVATEVGANSDLSARRPVAGNIVLDVGVSVSAIVAIVADCPADRHSCVAAICDVTRR